MEDVLLLSSSCHRLVVIMLHLLPEIGESVRKTDETETEREREREIEKRETEIELHRRPTTCIIILVHDRSVRKELRTGRRL